MNDEGRDRHIRELENIDDGIENLFDEMAPSEITEEVKVQGESAQEIVARVRRIFLRAHMNYLKKMEGSPATELGLESEKEDPQSESETDTRPALIRLLQLSRTQSGLTLGDLQFDDAAVRFAANSESVERLSKEEHKLLREYVRFLCER